LFNFKDLSANGIVVEDYFIIFNELLSNVGKIKLVS